MKTAPIEIREFHGNGFEALVLVSDGPIGYKRRDGTFAFWRLKAPDGRWVAKQYKEDFCRGEPFTFNLEDAAWWEERTPVGGFRRNIAKKTSITCEVVLVHKHYDGIEEHQIFNPNAPLFGPR